MGQPVAVVERPSSRPGIVRFEANRNLTGMGHERYTSISDAVGTTPCAVLAHRLLDSGKVDAVHIYQNIITVDLRKGFDADGLAAIVQDLYTYYRPGVVPPSDEELMAQVEAPAAAAAPAAGAAPTAGGDPNLSRVPAALLERSASARARWAAKAAG
jgi:hypothetical protein